MQKQPNTVKSGLTPNKLQRRPQGNNPKPKPVVKPKQKGK